VPFRPGPGIWVAMLGVGVVAVAIVVLALLASGDDGAAVATVPAREVPAVVGLAEEEAVTELQAAGFEAEVVHQLGGEPVGEVIEQTPEAGTALESGATVVVRVATAHEETTTVEEAATVPVPDVVGVDHVDGGAQVEDAGLVADSLPVDTDDPAGTVVAQEPAPATAVAAGSHVRLSVTIGGERQPAILVPEVVGRPAPEARATLREAGFTVRTIEHDADALAPGTVFGQEPEAGASIARFTRVTLHAVR
jgi:beta-lactam-binding protein with PASTA domain